MKTSFFTSAWARSFKRSAAAVTRLAAASGNPMMARTLKPAPARRKAPAGRGGRAREDAGAGAGSWSMGGVIGVGGARRFGLFRPPGVKPGERLPLVVMLHGCGQDAKSFAASTRMNRIAKRERFLVLYPEQDRLSNAQACWNWFDTRSGRAYAEVALIMAAVDQVCLLHPADRERVAVVGMSAGASMAALLATRHPQRFKAVVMHSGVPPGTANSGLSAMGAMHGHRPTRASPVQAARVTAGIATAWPPLLVIHGDADGVVSRRNGQAAAQAWAHAAGASANAAREVQRGRRHAMAVTDFKCQGTTAATLVMVHGLAHAWSGGAASQAHGDGQGPDASRMAWAFVNKQFLL